jgi:5-methylcytosine-specific restriction endonuclease McrA
MLVKKTSSLGQAVLAAYSDACAACGCADPASLEIDHVVPRASGGDNAPENLQVLCTACNKAKGAAIIGRLPPWRGETWGKPPQAATIARGK